MLEFLFPPTKDSKSMGIWEREVQNGPFKFNSSLTISQIQVEYLHLKNKWSTDSSSFKQRTQIEARWKPFSWRVFWVVTRSRRTLQVSNECFGMAKQSQTSSTQGRFWAPRWFIQIPLTENSALFKSQQMMSFWFWDGKGAEAIRSHTRWMKLFHSGGRFHPFEEMMEATGVLVQWFIWWIYSSSFAAKGGPSVWGKSTKIDVPFPAPVFQLKTFRASINFLLFCAHIKPKNFCKLEKYTFQHFESFAICLPENEYIFSKKKVI